jgi:uncharacterized protein DUF4242
MKRYSIERDLLGVGGVSAVDDKTFCVDSAENEPAVREHARLSGFPANKITEVRTIIDPMTAMS